VFTSIRQRVYNEKCIWYIYISMKYTRGISIVFLWRRFPAIARFATDVIICGHLFLYLKLTSSIASSIPVFFAAGGFHVIFQHPLLRIISSISTLCLIVTLLHSMNVVCPEIRVKGLAPIDSFRFLAFILLLWIAVVNFMPSFHSRGQCTWEWTQVDDHAFKIERF